VVPRLYAVQAMTRGNLTSSAATKAAGASAAQDSTMMDRDFNTRGMAGRLGNINQHHFYFSAG
jgi:hypothetical protein